MGEGRPRAAPVLSRIAGGEMAERVRAFDWSQTPVGPRDAWSPSLRLAVDMILATNFPMALRWGPELVLIYNDAYAPALHERHPGARFLVPLATRETRLLFEEALRRHAHLDLPIRILFGHAVEAMIAADVVLVASGTATLEAALLKRPMVITYKIGKWSYRLMRRLAYLPWVGLPNVLAGREVVPEVLQDAATPQALADALDGWLADPARVDELTRVFTDMHLQLRQDTAAKAAAAILPYLQGRAR